MSFHDVWCALHVLVFFKTHFHNTKDFLVLPSISPCCHSYVDSAPLLFLLVALLPCWFNLDVLVESIFLGLGSLSEHCLIDLPLYRCANCFDCPCCMHTLSTRATSIPAPLPDDPAKTTMKKAYYLACGFCRWTSRDVGMADKSVGKWQSKSENWVTAGAKYVFWK